MKKITMELPEEYASVLSITAIGRDKTNIGRINITTSAFDLDKGTDFVYTGSRWIQEEGADDGKG